MYKKANKEAIIQEEFKAYSVVWECEKGHKNFQTIIGKEGTQHDICLKCGEHYEYVVANGVEQSDSNCNIPLVVDECDHDYSDGTGTGYNVCKKCGDMY